MGGSGPLPPGSFTSGREFFHAFEVLICLWVLQLGWVGFGPTPPKRRLVSFSFLKCTFFLFQNLPYLHCTANAQVLPHTYREYMRDMAVRERLAVAVVFFGAIILVLLNTFILLR